MKQRGFFDHRNYIEKSTWKQREFFDQRNYTDKSTWKQRGFFDHRNDIEKSTWKQRKFFDHRNYIRVRGSNVGFWTSKITSKKVRGNDSEMTWKLVRFWSLTYWRNIDVKSTWIRGGVPVGHQLLQNFYPQKFCFFYLLLFNSWKTKRRKRNISYDNRKTSAETVSFSSISFIRPGLASFSF